MFDIGPRNGLESMLAAQMVSVHRVAMRLLSSGSSGEQSLDVATFRLNHASRLMRLFALQMDTLDRYRGKAPSEQKVTVERVHVNDGWQAVVGNVTAAPSAGSARQGGGG